MSINEMSAGWTTSRQTDIYKNLFFYIDLLFLKGYIEDAFWIYH